jgi:hypothetical protein
MSSRSSKHETLILLALMLAGGAAVAQAEDFPPGELYSGANGVGVGMDHPASRLDASGGEIRVGDSGDRCSVRNEGAIRYAKNNHRLLFCDGKDWRLLALDGGQ